MEKYLKPLIQAQGTCYLSPAIIHRGALKQFTGSPMNKLLEDPLDLSGK